MLGFGKKPLPPPPPPMAPTFGVADYFDTNSALIAILASLLILYPPKIQGKLLLWVVGGYGGWQLAVANGFQLDAAAAVASVTHRTLMFSMSEIGSRFLRNILE
jgi:hypothetical protein